MSDQMPQSARVIQPRPGNGPRGITVSTPDPAEVKGKHADSLDKDALKANAEAERAAKKAAKQAADEAKRVAAAERKAKRLATGFQSKLPQWARDDKPTEDRFQLMLWWIYVILHLHLTEIQPPAKVGAFARERVIARIEAKIELIRDYIKAIVGILSKKGGVGKTTLTSWLAVALSFAHKFPVAALDGDTGGGLIAARLGQHPDDTRVLSVLELAAMVERKEPLGFTRLARLTASHRGTSVLAYHMPPQLMPLAKDRTRHVLEAVQQDHLQVLADSPPGLQMPITNGIAQACDVPILVANGISREDIEDGLNVTLAHESYHLVDKLDELIIVIVKMPWRHCNSRSAHAIAERLNAQHLAAHQQEIAIRPDQIMFVPDEPYLVNKDAKSRRVVDRAKVSRRFILAIDQIAERVADTAVAINGHQDQVDEEFRRFAPPVSIESTAPTEQEQPASALIADRQSA